MNVKAHSTWPMYRALVGMGMACGLLIAIVFDGTQPIIERNRAEALQDAVLTVLPTAGNHKTFILTSDGSISDDTPEGNMTDGKRLYAGYDDSGNFVGVAIEASGMGYADTIALLYGYSPEDEQIVGMQVLASKETPGLGDKIETDASFVENFVALDVSLDASGTALRNRILTVKDGSKTQPWQIDGITGATISSDAVGTILDDSASRLVPIIAAQRRAFVTETFDAEP